MKKDTDIKNNTPDSDPPIRIKKIARNIPYRLRPVLALLSDHPCEKDTLIDFMIIKAEKTDLKEKNHRRYCQVHDHFNIQISELLDSFKRQELLSEQNNMFKLNDQGRQLADYTKTMPLPWYLRIFLEKQAALISIISQLLLVTIKIIFGLLFFSAGLINDGLNQFSIIFSNVLAGAGSVYQKQKLYSIIILFSNLGLIGLTVWFGVRQLIIPFSVKDPVIPLSIAFFSGIFIFALTIFQSKAGESKHQFSLQTQSIETGTMFFISMIVSVGLLLSLIASHKPESFLHRLDGYAALLIALLLLKEWLKQLIEYFRQSKATINISQLVDQGTKKFKRDLVYSWISLHIKDQPLPVTDLTERFKLDFINGNDSKKSILINRYSVNSIEDFSYYLANLHKINQIKIQDNLCKPAV
jgi:magnesium-transporting ATPase (P-type)